MNELIQQYALPIIAALGGSNLLVMAASIIKAFNQKTLNKSFEKFNVSAVLNQNTADLVKGKVLEMSDRLDGYANKIEEFANDLQNIKSEELFDKLKEGLMDLDTVKLALDMKDQMIESYGRDIREIKAALEALRQRGE